MTHHEWKDDFTSNSWTTPIARHPPASGWASLAAGARVAGGDKEGGLRAFVCVCVRLVNRGIKLSQLADLFDNEGELNIGIGGM